MPVKNNKVQQAILDAAHARFVKYGFKKTNMTEIAVDTEMSPGNLYRFFASKEEMGAAVVQRILSKKRVHCHRVIKEEHSSLENLKFFCRFLLDFYYDIYETQEHVTELIDLVFAKQQGIVEELIEKKETMIHQILETGIKKDEFRVEDAKRESSILVRLLHPFLFPNWGLYQKQSIEELHLEMSSAIDLIYRGLQNK